MSRRTVFFRPEVEWLEERCLPCGHLCVPVDAGTDGTPLAVPDEFRVLENSVLSGNVRSNDMPHPNIANDFAQKLTDPVHGRLSFNPDGSFTYTPDPGYEGQDVFTYQLVGTTCAHARVSDSIPFVGIGQRVCTPPVATNPATVSITVDPSPRVGITPTAGLITTETGGAASFDVVLNEPPLSEVTIPLSSSDDSEGTASTASLTFTPQNWHVPQTVTVTGVDDAMPDGDQAYVIVLGPATSADPAFVRWDTPDVTLTNLDNEVNVPGSTGFLDLSFGVGGKVLITDYDWYDDIAVQADGKIVAIAGGIVARFNSDGSVDRDFGVNGEVQASIVISGVAIQDDGKIVIAGSRFTCLSDCTQNFVVARLTSEGKLDTDLETGFGDPDVLNPGRRTGSNAINLGYDDHPWYGSVAGMVIQNDGGIVVAGSTRMHCSELPYSDQWCYGFAVMRVTSSGTLDPTFGVGGLAITDFGLGKAFARDIALQEDGKIVLVGIGQWGTATAMARYTPSGALDPTFGTAGMLLDSCDGCGGHAVAIQDDGRIIVTGDRIRRYNSDGALHDDFADLPLYASEVAVQANGRIVVAGWTPSGDFGLTRYLPAGTLDPSFGNNGHVVTDDEGNGFSYAFPSGLAIQADGKIVVAGSGPGIEALLARYHAAPLTIAIDDVARPEGKNKATPFTFTVTLSYAIDQPVNVSFASVDGTATTADRDYAPVAGTLTFLPGETSKTLTVLVRSDRHQEPDESFFLNISDPSHGVIGRGPGTGTILNDDGDRVAAIVATSAESQSDSGAGSPPRQDELAALLFSVRESSLDQFFSAFGANTPPQKEELTTLLLSLDESRVDQFFTLSEAHEPAPMLSDMDSSSVLGPAHLLTDALGLDTLVF